MQKKGRRGESQEKGKQIENSKKRRKKPKKGRRGESQGKRKQIRE